MLYVVLDIDEEASRAKLKSIQTLLAVPTLVDEYHDIMEGSCQWIENLSGFKEWRDSTTSVERDGKFSPWIYWISASPGAGKTVLAAHVQSQLQELHIPHTAYYFHYGNKTTQSLAVLLRSIAYDMAKSNAAVRERLGRLSNDSSTFDLDDVRAIWSIVFRAGIFQVYMIFIFLVIQSTCASSRQLTTCYFSQGSSP